MDATHCGVFAVTHMDIADTNENTIAMWTKNAGIGEIREENHYDPVKITLASESGSIDKYLDWISCEKYCYQESPVSCVAPSVADAS